MGQTVFNYGDGNFVMSRGFVAFDIARMALLTSAQRQGLEIKQVAIWDRT